MTEQATEAAQGLAAVLLAQSENLASNDLTTVAAAMTAVRAAAREVEAALRARGWGGGVLYGFGAPLDDEDENEDDFDESDFDDATAELDDIDEDADGEDTWAPPPGIRMSYQARYDFVVVDEEAFLAYVERLGRAAGKSWTREDIEEHTPAFMLTELITFANQDFEGSGIVFAGGQDAVPAVPITLWEMDYESQGDHYPTVTSG